MRRRGISCLLALCLAVLVCVPVPSGWAESGTPSSGGVVYEEEDLVFKENDDSAGKGSGSGSELDKINDANASAIGALGKKDWEARAKAVRRTGKWRDDLIAVAATQIGYAQDKSGLTIYDRRPEGKRDKPVAWTALFISWVAEQTGLTEKQFPREESYKAMVSRMKKLHALKKITRSDYPVSGDLALIESEGQHLLAIVTYVSNGYAAVIHGDDNGRVTRATYRVSSAAFSQYVDLNVLMEKAGIEVGKGGEVPLIPEGGVSAWTNTNAVYLRSEPTTVCRSLTTVKKKGTAMLAVSAALQEDGYIWYGVKYGKYEGYIRGDLLELDRAALSTATPEPTPVPTATPLPGCSVCTGAAEGMAMPWDCCYAHLASLSPAELVRFMTSLQTGDPASFLLYVRTHEAHVSAGAQPLLCLGADCGAAAWNNPGPAHEEGCPWHQPMAAHSRVVSIETRQALDGQQVTIHYTMSGAVAYQWHEVQSIRQDDGTTVTLDTPLEGETAASLTVTARARADIEWSYYCVATILTGGETVQVTGKMTRLNVGDAPVMAQAILGEKVNFTYAHDGAAAYLWYVQADLTQEPTPIIASDEAYTGARTATLSFLATAENAGMLYSCAALDAGGRVLARSGRYAYTLQTYAELPDPAVCAGHDLCHYGAELANMSREERFTAVTETWNVPVTPGAPETLANLVLRHWQLCHRETYPKLLCTCATETLLRHPTREAHREDCPWHRETRAALAVTVAGMQPGESALIQVTVTDAGVSRVYTLALSRETPTAVIADLPVGSTYAVTELTGWSWRYGSQPDIAPAKGTIGPDTDRNVTVTNQVRMDRWLHDEGSTLLK